MEYDAEYERAEATLVMNKDIYWCIICSAPRFKRYCPASSHSSREHTIIPRNRLALETQIQLYLKRERYRGER